MKEKGTSSRPLRRALLGAPLFYKLLVGNVVVIGIAAASAIWLLVRTGPGSPGFLSPMVWLLLAAVLLLGTLVSNGIVVRLALQPLKGLERAARAISPGRPAPRVPLSPLADRDFERLIVTFNHMLDQVERYETRLRGLAARSLAVQEEERTRISQELHDDTGQRLTAILLRLGVLRSRVSGSPLEQELEAVREELVAAVETVRAFARGLRPPALTELGLVPAIEAHLREVRENSSFSVHFERPEEEPGLSPEAELAAYRIIQEAVSNARRHASPERLGVAVAVGDDQVELTVEDDGHGFHAGKVLRRRHDGRGLFGMEERARHLGGRAEVTSEPGRGTTVSVLIPRAGSQVSKQPHLQREAHQLRPMVQPQLLHDAGAVGVHRFR